VTPGTAASIHGVPSLRYAFVVGDVLTKKDVSGLVELAPLVTCVNFYGTTETQRAVGYYVVSEDGDSISRESIPLGRGVPDVQLLVLNASQELAGIGELGEIYIRSPHLARGYLDDDKLNQERFITNPFTDAPGDRLYKTGDLGRYLPDGNVEFHGRADDQVKIRGFRIELGEVRAVLERHPKVREAVVLAREEMSDGGRASLRGKRLVAYVVTKDGQTSNVGELRRFVQKRLPAYMVPSAFVTLESLPLTSNGKVDRRALPEPDQTQPEFEESSWVPRNKVEELLAEIWAEILDWERVSGYDNFFELGGHSLLAAQLVAQVRNIFQIDLPLRSLFESPTIIDLAKVIEKKLEGGSHPQAVKIVPVSRERYRIQVSAEGEVAPFKTLKGEDG
jgi:acyl carrier protein